MLHELVSCPINCAINWNDWTFLHHRKRESLMWVKDSPRKNRTQRRYSEMCCRILSTAASKSVIRRKTKKKECLSYQSNLSNLSQIYLAISHTFNYSLTFIPATYVPVPSHYFINLIYSIVTDFRTRFSFFFFHSFHFCMCTWRNVISYVANSW